MKTVESLYSGDYPEPGALLDQLETVFPLISEMPSTPQDTEWHAEGDVRIHTEMVISEAVSNTELAPGEKAVLILGAALHDIGKPLTTREEEIKGRMRIVSPHHAERGCGYVAPSMSALGLAGEDMKTVMGLIRFHHDLRKLVAKSAAKHLYSRLARSVDLRMLYLLEQCDIRGRICPDEEAQLEILELFRLEAENFGLWQTPDPYVEWKSFLSENIPEESEYNYALGRGIYEYEHGLINSPEEALARTWEHRKDYSQVTMVSAPSGSGKSTWVKQNLASDAVLVSLDEIRQELTGKRGDQSKNGQVLQVGKERLREALRKKQDVFWDSTALRRDARAMVLGLAHDYHAATRIVALAAPLKTALQRNKKRGDQIPSSVIEKQYRSWQWPELHEAHHVKYVF